MGILGYSKLKEYTQDIINQYVNEKRGLKLIAKQYNVDKKTVKRLLENNGVTINSLNHEPYYFNEHYFDIIDSPNKAYILGILYADGCNLKQYNGIKITLEEKDREILEKIRIEMEVSKPLQYYERKNKNPNWNNTYELKIYSKHMCETLEKLGCVPKKSLILDFPDFLPDDLMSHFIRGYFDGDGHINKSGRGAHASFVSSMKFCQGLSLYLTSIGIENKIYTVPTNVLSGGIRISKKVETKKLMDFMYKNADLYME